MPGARISRRPAQRRTAASRRRPSAGEILEAAPESTVLDVVDELLNRGVVADGDLTLGVAGVDLIYLRLSALLCAADRVLPRDERPAKVRSRPRQPGPRTR